MRILLIVYAQEGTRGFNVYSGLRCENVDEQEFYVFRKS